jgi:hypothetical protein
MYIYIYQEAPATWLCVPERVQCPYTSQEPPPPINILLVIQDTLKKDTLKKAHLAHGRPVVSGA